MQLFRQWRHIIGDLWCGKWFSVSLRSSRNMSMLRCGRRQIKLCIRQKKVKNTKQRLTEFLYQSYYLFFVSFVHFVIHGTSSLAICIYSLSAYRGHGYASLGAILLKIMKTDWTFRYSLFLSSAIKDCWCYQRHWEKSGKYSRRFGL